MISAPFILRPVATTLLTVAVIMLGLIGYRLLPVAALPDVDFPTIQMVTAYPGGSPDVVETSVTAPLEHHFGQISGLTNMSSTSAYGTSQITLTFDLSRNIDAVAQDVQASIDAAAGWIPIALLPGPPVYHEVNPADVPVLILALTSNTMPLHQVNDYAATTLVQKLSQIGSVGAVTVEGGQTRAVRLQADVAKLAGLGLSLEDVRRAVSANTVDNPKGQLDGVHQAFQIGANDQLLTADAYESTVVAYRNGAPVLLRDIGHAVDSVENAELAPWYNGAPAVILDVQRQPGANTIQVVEAVRAAAEAFRQPAAGAEDLRGDRPHHDDSCRHHRRAIDAAADGGFGSHGDLPVPAQAVGNGDSVGRAAGVADRHIRRHGGAGLQPKQPVADGADDRLGFRRGRCDCDDREHRTLR